MRSKHKEEFEKSATHTQEVLKARIALDEEDTDEQVVQTSVAVFEKSSNAGIKCDYCEKHCANSASLKIHMRYKHKEELEKSAVPTQEVSDARNALDEEETNEQIANNDEGITNTNVGIRKSTR
jgi:hypothetical protein